MKNSNTYNKNIEINEHILHYKTGHHEPMRKHKSATTLRLKFSPGLLQ